MKIFKNIIINILVVVFALLMPLYIYKYYQDDYRKIAPIQNYLFLLILLGSLFLIYFNNLIKRDIKIKKMLWFTFEIIGILGFVYSLVVLLLIFIFRNGIGL